MELPNSVYLKKNDFVSISTNAKDQNKRYQEIIDSIAFELRIPVTIMKSNIQLLKKRCNGSDNSYVEESFLLCEDSVDNILRFINCVSFLSDMGNGRPKLKKISFNLTSFLHQVMEELRQSNLDVSRVNIHIAVSGSNIITDKYLLNRILINLLMNALKFSRSMVELNILELENQLTLNVRDYGIGIPEEEIREVFNPFVRASNVKMISGTGLGLSIITKAVDCLDGTVYVNSMVGKGTEFKIIIPLAPVIEMKLKAQKITSLIPQY